MELKRVGSLQEGDKLKQKGSGELHTLKEIIKSKEGTNYYFQGFCVRERLLHKFFRAGESGIFVYND
jgi:hypothetical protein